MNSNQILYARTREKELSYRVIDFHHGLPSPPKDNMVISYHENLFNVFPKTIFHEFQNISFFWYVTLIGLLFSPYSSSTSLKLGILIPVIILILYNMFQKLYQSHSKYRFDSEINEKEVTVLRNTDIYKKKSKNLCVGDIVLIKNTETVPADIILLAVDGAESEIFVDMFDVIGTKDLVKKVPVKDTQEYIMTDIPEVKNLLKHIENVRVSQPDSSFNTFSGKIKMKGNPKVAKVNIENLLIMGTKIVGYKEVIGIAVYTGMETKTWLNSKKEKLIQVTKLRKFINVILSINFALLLIFTLISFGLSKLKSIPIPDEALQINFVENLILFNDFVPISLYLTLRIMKLVYVILINFTNPGIRIENPKVFETLGKVEYVLIGKNRVLTNEKLQIQSLLIGIQAYVSDFDRINSEYDNLSEKFEEKVLDIEEYDQNTEIEAKDFEEIVKELNKEEINSEIWSFILCLTLCNHYYPEEDSKNISLEEKIIVAKAEELGIKLVRRTVNFAVINFLNTEYTCDIYGSFGLFSEQEINKIVIRESITNNVILFVKGSTNKMLKLFDNEEDFLIAEEQISSKYLLNLQKIICGYKILTEEESNSFIFEYKHSKLSPINVDGRIESVFEKFEKNLTYLGIIGIKNPITENSKKCVESLTKAGIKCWVLTGENEEGTLVTASGLGLINADTHIVKLSNSSSSSEVLQAMTKAIDTEIFHEDHYSDRINQHSGTIQQIKSDLYLDAHLKELELHKFKTKVHEVKNSRENFKGRKRRSNEKGVVSGLIMSLSNVSLDQVQNKRSIEPENINFVLSVNSSILEFALSSLEHRRKLVLLLFTAKCVMFYSMLPDQKIKLVYLLKNNFSFRPCTLAVGGGHTNTGMLDTADIGISVTPLENKTGYIPDIKISEFCELSKLILQYGHYSYINLCKVVTLTVYKQMLVHTIFFLYQIQNNFSGNWFIDYDLMVLFELFTSLVPITLIGVFSRDSEDTEVSEVYSKGFFNFHLKKSKIFMNYLLGLVHGCCVYSIVMFGVGNIVNSKGYTEDVQTKGIAAFILINFAITQAIFTINFKVSILNGFILAFQILMMIFIVYLISDSKITQYNVDILIFQGQSTIFFIICIFPLIMFLSTFAIFLLLGAHDENQFKNRLDQYKKNIEKVYQDTKIWNKEEISSELDLKKWNLRFKSEFKENEYQNLISQYYKNTYRVILFIICGLTWILLILSATNLLNAYSLSILIYIVAVLMTISCMATFYNKLIYEYFTMVNFIVFIIVLAVEIAFSQEYLISPFTIVSVFFSIFISFRIRATAFQLLTTLIISIISVFVQSSMFNYSLMYHISFHTFIYMISLCTLCLVISYFNDLFKRNEIIYLQTIELKVTKVKNIFSYLLPQFVRKRVKDGVKYIAEDKGTVSVIFCDMCNFDDIVSQYSSQELTSFLDMIFGKLDKLCERLGVTKIETVGKTYLACAGLKDSQVGMDPSLTSVPHARRAIEMGLAVIREVEKITLKDGSPLMFKIGINSGPVTAGVVGYHKPQFSLVGDTVNTASRMSSTLTQPNSIQITIATYEMLEDYRGLLFYDRSPDVKGKGIMKTKIVDTPKHSTELSNEKITSNPTFGNNFLGSSLIGSYSSNINSEITPQKQNIFTFDTDSQNSHLENIEKMWSFQRIFKFYVKDNQEVSDLRKEIAKAFYLQNYFSITISILSNSCLILLEILEIVFNDQRSVSIGLLIIYITEEVIFILLAKNFKKYHENKFMNYCLNLGYFVEFPSVFILSLFSDMCYPMIILFFSFRFLQMNYCCCLFLDSRLITNTLCLFFWFFTISLESDSRSENILSSILYIMVILVSSYMQEKRLMLNSLEKKLATKDFETTDELLNQMLPPHVLKNLQEENLITDRLMNVTLMYADIVGFTAWSSKKTPKEVVGMLSDLFTKFDKLCLKHNVYKVHTIGDCYVVMGYRSEVKRIPAQEAVNVVEFAKSLIDVIEATNKAKKCELSMRVGIHTGEVIGGITGTNIVRYDIYGSDVLIANKMESNGEPGRIVVSEVTKIMLEEYKSQRYKFSSTKNIHIPVLNKHVEIFLLTDLAEVLDSN